MLSVFFYTLDLVHSARRLSTRAFFGSLISCMRLAILRETKKSASFGVNDDVCASSFGHQRPHLKHCEVKVLELAALTHPLMALGEDIVSLLTECNPLPLSSISSIPITRRYKLLPLWLTERPDKFLLKCARVCLHNLRVVYSH